MTVRVTKERGRWGPTFSIADEGGYWLDGAGRRRAWSTESAAGGALEHERGACSSCGAFWLAERLEMGLCPSCEHQTVSDDAPPTAAALDRWANDDANAAATLGDLAHAFGLSVQRVIAIRNGQSS